MVVNEIFDENPGQSSSCSDVAQNCEVGRTPGGLLPYKSGGGGRQKISRTPLKGTRILFYGRVPNSFHP